MSTKMGLNKNIACSETSLTFTRSKTKSETLIYSKRLNKVAYCRYFSPFNLSVAWILGRGDYI